MGSSLARSLTTTLNFTDGTLILWNLSDEVPKTGFADEANEAQFATEVWKIRRSLRFARRSILRKRGS